jgi:hypothetical protein
MPHRRPCNPRRSAALSARAGAERGSTARIRWSCAIWLAGRLPSGGPLTNAATVWWRPARASYAISKSLVHRIPLGGQDSQRALAIGMGSKRWT